MTKANSKSNASVRIRPDLRELIDVFTAELENWDYSPATAAAIILAEQSELKMVREAPTLSRDKSVIMTMSVGLNFQISLPSGATYDVKSATGSYGEDLPF